jgi:hypothetical protein
VVPIRKTGEEALHSLYFVIPAEQLLPDQPVQHAHAAVNMESRPLPSMCDFSHDGQLCTFTIQYERNWKCNELASDIPSGQTVQSGREGSTDRPSKYKSHLPDHSLPELSWTPCRANPLYSSQLPGMSFATSLTLSTSHSSLPLFLPLSWPRCRSGLVL